MTANILEARLWLVQRGTSAILALCVLVHLATLIYAVRHGLTASAMLARTRGNIPIAVFYGIFVVAVAIHTPLGLRTVCEEWLGWRRGLGWALAAYGAVLLIGGLRAVYALVWAVG